MSLVVGLERSRFQNTLYLVIIIIMSEEEGAATTPIKPPTASGEPYPLFSEADFANYFCSYAQLYHQKHMLADHNRMAAYHSAILGNQEVFRDKVVMDIGTGSGIRKCDIF